MEWFHGRGGGQEQIEALSVTFLTHWVPADDSETMSGGDPAADGTMEGLSQLG